MLIIIGYLFELGPRNPFSTYITVAEQRWVFYRDIETLFIQLSALLYENAGYMFCCLA